MGDVGGPVALVDELAARLVEGAEALVLVLEEAALVKVAVFLQLVALAISGVPLPLSSVDLSFGRGQRALSFIKAADLVAVVNVSIAGNMVAVAFLLAVHPESAVP